MQNPSIGSACTLVLGNSYCVERNYGIPTEITKTSSSLKPTATNGIATPTPIQSGMVTNCNKFYYVAKGDGCYNIAASYSITLDQLYLWNPALNECKSLWPDTYICVSIIGLQPPATTSASTTITPTPTTTTPTNGITTPTPIQSGMVTNCNRFYYVVKGDSCYDIAASYSITLNQLYLWNPALDSCKSLWPETYICVSIVALTSSTSTTKPPTVTSTPTSTKTTFTNGVPTPTPYQSGLTTNCNKFYFVKDADTCYDIAKANSISLDQFYAWNPAVGNTCATLWPKYYVCVGIIGVTTSPLVTTMKTSTTLTFTIPQCTFNKTKGEYVCPSAEPKRRAVLEKKL